MAKAKNMAAGTVVEVQKETEKKAYFVSDFTVEQTNLVDVLVNKVYVEFNKSYGVTELFNDSFHIYLDDVFQCLVHKKLDFKMLLKKLIELNVGESIDDLTVDDLILLTHQLVYKNQGYFLGKFEEKIKNLGRLGKSIEQAS